VERINQVLVVPAAAREKTNTRTGSRVRRHPLTTCSQTLTYRESVAPNNDALLNFHLPALQITNLRALHFTNFQHTCLPYTPPVQRL
jgi:hypothetical protein